MNKTWFITGTDTDAGKTVAGVALLQAAADAGYRTVGYKPVASGCETVQGVLRNADALALQSAATVQMEYQAVNPYAFAEATAPHIVSDALAIPIDLAQMSAGLKQLQQRSDWTFVEGAGGWFTPLSAQQTYADWVMAEKLPVILVVGMKLGCINHALLTAQAIRHAGLSLAGWIACQVIPTEMRYQEYLASLVQRLDAPLLGEIPHQPDILAQPLGQYIDLTPLHVSVEPAVNHERTLIKFA